MKTKRLLTLAGAATAVAWLGACSSGPAGCPPGETGAPPNCTVIPTPSTCTQAKLVSAPFGIDAKALDYADFSVPNKGRLDMTLDWTNAPSPMGLYLVPANTCSLDEFNKRTCNFLVQSEPSATKPRKVSAPNLAAGNYRWLVANFSDAQESVSLQIVLSQGDGCPAFGSAAPGGLARGSGLPLTVERAVRP
ncbi:MAG TPA: hypothetical protein VMT70_18620 [Vicinamibacteria bacterium]|nr:hypothetical protein [Vicinamibacteria bacterium]